MKLLILHFLIFKGIVFFENLAESPDECEDVMRDMQLDDVVQGHSNNCYHTSPCPSIVSPLIDLPSCGVKT